VRKEGQGRNLPTWKLTIEYDGTRFFGWQEQKNARTIAGELRGAAVGVLGNSVELTGAGRTDSGVHALGQVARLSSATQTSDADLQFALNDRLPPDINVLRVESARSRFDPRRDAKLRYYLYQISTRRSAFAKRFVWWVKDRLEFDRMSEACRSLRGRYDFAAFCDKRLEDRSTIVEVNSAELSACGDLIVFRIGASHFLWKMVRRIVGTMVQIGRFALAPEDLRGLLKRGQLSGQARTFQVAEHTAPPSGLFLERVVYGNADALGAIAPAFAVPRASANDEGPPRPQDK